MILDPDELTDVNDRHYSDTRISITGMKMNTPMSMYSCMISHGLLEYTDGKVKTTVKNVKIDLIKIGKVNEFTSGFLQLLDILLGY